MTAIEIASKLLVRSQLLIIFSGHTYGYKARLHKSISQPWLNISYPPHTDLPSAKSTIFNANQSNFQSLTVGCLNSKKLLYQYIFSKLIVIHPEFHEKVISNSRSSEIHRAGIFDRRLHRLWLSHHDDWFDNDGSSHEGQQRQRVTKNHHEK